ncbi:MAG: major capsid protein [Proteobacteria bacterium]|nr:major capsid protein [Pseudomonadota bacterium]
MPKDISEVYSAEALVAYYTALKNGGDAHYQFIGEKLFPILKRKGLSLEWIKGSHGAPAELRPAAFDTTAFVRPRIRVNEVRTKIPFFKEAEKFTEEERQELMETLRLHGDDENYINGLMRHYYRQYADLLAGSDVDCEKMRMSLLAYGKIDVVWSKDGVNINEEYNYDTSGNWATNNTHTLTGTSTWTDANKATCDPVKDISDCRKMHKMKNGVITTRVLMNSETFSRICQADATRKAIKPLGGNILDSEVETYIKDATKSELILNDAIYKNANGENAKYYPDGKVTLLPAYTLGYTNYGTTPTEFDILNGENNLHSHGMYNEGVCVYTNKTIDPVNVKTIVEMLALPSFEEMDSVFVLNAF